MLSGPPDLVSTPPQGVVGSLESKVLAHDFTLAIPSGSIVSITSVTLIDVATGVAYTAGLSGAASISGLTVRQRFANFQVGHAYTWTTTVLDSDGNTQELITQLLCPE